MKRNLLFVGLWFGVLGGFAGEPGVVLFRGSEFRGKNEVLTVSDPDLHDNRIGGDRLSSIAIPPGYTVTLFEHVGYRGCAIVLDRDEPHLDHTDLGKNTASSILITREKGHHRNRDRGPFASRGQDRRDQRPGRNLPVKRDRGDSVTLYNVGAFKGASQTYNGNESDLSRSGLGKDAVVSLRVPRGLLVTLYEHENFRGRWESFSEDDPNLMNNWIGARRASSMRIQVLPPAMVGRGAGVILYEHNNFGGRQQAFIGDVPDLNGSQIGNDRGSSIRITPGFRVTLYEHPDYRGESEVIQYDDADLANNRIGKDRASSLRVQWVGR